MRGEVEGRADHIEFTTEERRDQRVDDPGAQLDFHFRLLAAEGGNDRRQHAHRPYRTGTHLYGAAGATLNRLNFGHRMSVFEIHEPGPAREYFAETGRHDARRQSFEE